MDLDRTKTALAQITAERDALQKRLYEATGEADRLRAHVAAAQEKLTAYRTQERLLAETVAERDALQKDLQEATTETDRLREQVERSQAQVAAAQEKLAAFQTQERLLAETVAERGALQEELREAITETGRVREQAQRLQTQVAAAQEKLTAYQTQERLLAETVAERDTLQKRLHEATSEARRLREQTDRLQAQAAAAQETLAARETQERLLAQTVGERDALQKRLHEATAEADRLREQTGRLREQAAAAQEKLAARETQERLITQTFLSAQQAAEDLTQRTRAQGEDTITRADSAARDIIQSARRSAAEILRQAHTRAEEAVRAAEQTAAARLAQLRIETDRMTEEARQAAAGIQRSARQYVTDLVTRIETSVPDRQRFRNLSTLTEDLADSLDALTRLLTGVQNEILPALRELARKLREEEAEPGRRAAAALPLVPPDAASPAPSEEPTRQRPDRPAEQERIVSLGVRGEIVIRPVNYHYQAVKMATAVSRMKGIRSARLRALVGNTACVELTTETGPLTGLDFTVIDGVPMEVVEATDTRLVLRIARPFAQSLPG